MSIRNIVEKHLIPGGYKTIHMGYAVEVSTNQFTTKNMIENLIKALEDKVEFSELKPLTDEDLAKWKMEDGKMNTCLHHPYDRDTDDFGNTLCSICNKMISTYEDEHVSDEEE